jgi:predicted Holliday junction resolvase-like endonuclease
MELPTEAVNTLSDTAWGAIWIITVVVMGSVIASLSFYIRSLNRTIVSISNDRTNDAKEMYESSQKLTRESLMTVDKACRAIDDLGGKITNVESAISRFRTGGSG